MNFDDPEGAPTNDFELKSSNARFVTPPEDLPKIMKSACDAVGIELTTMIGSLSVTPPIIQDRWRRAVQIRSEPLPAFGGAEFRHHVRLDSPSNLLPVTTERLAESMRMFAGSRIWAPDYIEEIKSIVTDKIALCADSDQPITILAIGLQPPELGGIGGQFVPTVELALLGCDLTPRTVRFQDQNFERLKGDLEVAVAEHARRAHLLRKNKKKGSTWWIEDTTLRLMHACGLTISFAHYLLNADTYFAFSFDQGRQDAWIEWQDGVLTCSARAPGFTFKNNNLTINQHFPETLMLGIKGRKLGQVVEHAWIPPDAVIARVAKNWQGTRMKLKVTKMPLAWDLVDEDMGWIADWMKKRCWY